MVSNTIEFYDNHAKAFVENTINVDFSHVQDRFLSYIPRGGHVLDFGCGSGRDTKYFISKGYQVDAIDGSEKLCEAARKSTGIAVRQMLFTELEEDSVYDGIWACASILHLPKEELQQVFGMMIRAVKPGGYMYTSFKYGGFEGDRNGRYYIDFTEESFQKFADGFSQVRIVEKWTSYSVLPDRDDEKWLNSILQRV